MTTLTDSLQPVLARLAAAGDAGIPVAFASSPSTVSVVHASALEDAGLAHLATTNEGRRAWITAAGITHHTNPPRPEEDAMHDTAPDRPVLTPTQEDLLRRMVGHARYADGARLGRTTDPNLREVNGRAARAVADHGLLAIEDRDGVEWVVVTDEGRAWVHWTEGVAAGTAELMADGTDALTRAADEHPALTQEAPGVYTFDPAMPEPSDAQDSGDQEAPDDEGAAEPDGDAAPDTAISDDHPSSSDEPAATAPAGAAPTELPPSVGAATRHFEGIRIVGDAIKVKASVVDGGADLRHGDEAVVLLIVHVDDIAHPGNESGVIRTVVAKPAEGFLLDAHLGDRLVDGLARLRAQRATGSGTLLDPGDNPDDDLAAIAAALDDQERRDRDDKGRRDFGDRYDDDRRPPRVTEEQLQAVADELLRNPDGFPVRSLQEDALRELVDGGRARIEPDWWFTDHARRSELGDSIPMAFWTGEVPTANEAVMELLEATEADRPQVRIDRVDGTWRAQWPDDWEGVPDTAATLVQLQEQCDEHAGLLEGETLDWRRTAQGGWTAGLPVVDPDKVPF